MRNILDGIQKFERGVIGMQNGQGRDDELVIRIVADVCLLSDSDSGGDTGKGQIGMEEHVGGIANLKVRKEAD